MNTINERISLLIETIGITKTAFAKELKVSQQYISKLTKTGTPSDILLEDISEKFGVNPEWLISGTGEMFIRFEENHIIKRATILLGEKDPLFESFVVSYSKLNQNNRKVLIDFGLDFLNELKNRTEEKEG